MNQFKVRQLAEDVALLSKDLSANNVPDERITYCLTAFIRQCVIELFDQEREEK